MLPFDSRTKAKIELAPIKARDRAWQKPFRWTQDAATIWPPLHREVTDVIRATVIFQSSYMMACFSAYMIDQWSVVRLDNYFEGVSTDGTLQTVPRIVINCAFDIGGRQCIAEVQLQLRILFFQAKLNHLYYQVVRATTPDQVVGKIEWPTGDERHEVEAEIRSEMKSLEDSRLRKITEKIKNRATPLRRFARLEAQG